MNEQKLITSYKTACNNLLIAFCKKHDYDFEGWVAEEFGATAILSGDYYVDMQTVITDIKEDAPINEFSKWYDYCLRVGILGCATPDFKSWLMRCPIRSEKEIAEMEASRDKIAELEKELKKMIENGI